MGGSSSVGALIIGTVFLSIFAHAMVAAIGNLERISAVENQENLDIKVQIVNATFTSGTLYVNITNIGSDSVPLDEVFLSYEGGTPRNFSHFYTGSDYLFPGETVMGSALVSGTPTRAYVASHGVGFGAIIQ